MNANDIDIKHPGDVQVIYFVGIGGIGMSALARFFNLLGAQVFGYDRVETTLTKKLVDEGMTIHYDDNPEFIPKEIDLVVYTPAIPADHKELNWMIGNGFLLFKRAQVLGWISKAYKTIAVSGTHGKTTTSSILTHLLRTGNIDCSAFLGGIASDFASNFVYGSSEWIVVEADEYDRSFLHLHPFHAIVLSLDADHLDIYGAHDELKATFQTFVQQIDPKGSLISKNGLEVRNTVIDQITYGIDEGNVQAKNVRVEHGSFFFDYHSEFVNINNIKLALPGRHNVSNAVAAITMAYLVGVKPSAIKIALASFKGIKRRFDLKYLDATKIFIDDYAHHPTELNAAISAARELHPKKRITGIFQPHLFSRTKDFLDEFAAALDNLDQVFLLDIYPARELPIPNVTSERILMKMSNPNVELVSKKELLGKVKNWKGGVLMTLGAGDIDRLVEPIKTILENN